MSARVGVLIFPGTNSEDETARACRAAGLATDLVHWNADLDAVRAYDAYVLPGGFAYEDRVRAGAIAAHDRLMVAVREGAAAGKPVLGICNGAQILLESGLAPALGGELRAQAGFARNAPTGRYRSTHVYVRLAIAPERCAITRSLPPHAVLPAWASHGEGRLAAHPSELERMAAGDRIAFVYCDARGVATPAAVPNGSALGAAAVVNDRGNVLAIMPHPERDAFGFMHHASGRAGVRSTAAMLAPSGGIALFRRPREGARPMIRSIEVALTIPDNEARTALATLRRLGVVLGDLERADLYRFDVDDASAAALVETVRTIETIYNPSKHRLRVLAADVPSAGEVWIADLGEDGASGTATRIAGRTIAGLRSYERSTVWRLASDGGGPASPAVVASATELLLCNPAFQKASLA